MLGEIAHQELKTLRSSFGASALTLWRTWPLFLFGWIVATIGRHPEAEAEIAGELAYKVLILTEAGLRAWPAITSLIFLLLFLCSLSYFLEQSGKGEAIDGMRQARAFMRNVLLPQFIGLSAFASGVICGSDMKGLLRGVAVFVCLALFAAYSRYIVDTMEQKRGTPQH